ncbi:unnamed protein product [Phytomonas sp. EM1]|nr:unnamed protein product [Phytomonas sp. EM1]|eukprot:CCW60494.1 unnamed protein product [Phytomonas sp. isolate EM1]
MKPSPAGEAVDPPAIASPNLKLSLPAPRYSSEGESRSVAGKEAPPPPPSACSSSIAASYLAPTPRASLSTSVKGLVEAGQLAFLVNSNADLDYRVNKLLDVEIDDDFNELAGYIDEVVPDFFTRRPENPFSSGDPPSEGEATAAPRQRSLSKASTAPSPPHSVSELRSVLQEQIIHTHRDFLRELKQLYDTFLDASEHVRELDRRCGELEMITNARAQETAAFVQHLATLEAELQLVDQRDHALREFREKLNFGAEEQRVLAEEPVGPRFLDALARTRRVHVKSLAFSHLPEYQRSASAVAETTYRAILLACEKIARYLLLATPVERFGEEDEGGNPGGGRTAIAADAPGGFPDFTSARRRCCGRRAPPGGGR